MNVKMLYSSIFQDFSLSFSFLFFLFFCLRCTYTTTTHSIESFDSQSHAEESSQASSQLLMWRFGRYVSPLFFLFLSFFSLSLLFFLMTSSSLFPVLSFILSGMLFSVSPALFSFFFCCYISIRRRSRERKT